MSWPAFTLHLCTQHHPLPTTLFGLGSTLEERDERVLGHPGGRGWKGVGEGSALLYLEPVVPHGQVEDVIPLLLFAPFGQQLWGVGRKEKGKNPFSSFLVPVSQTHPPLPKFTVLSLHFSSSHSGLPSQTRGAA